MESSAVDSHTRPQKLTTQSAFLTWGIHRWCTFLGLIHLIYAYDLSTQILGLIGENGVNPWYSRAQLILNQHQNLTPWFSFPTGLWWSGASDQSILGWTWIWMGCALLLIFRLFPILSGLGCLMGSITIGQVAHPFTSFQWDLLLNEMTALSLGGLISLKSISLMKGHTLDDQSRIISFRHHRLCQCGLRCLLFKVMWDAGLAKLLSGDQTWQDLSALQFHFWTQPLPHGGTDWGHALPALVKKWGCAATLWIEVWGPFFLIYRIRYWMMGWSGCLVIAALTSWVPTLTNTLFVLIWLCCLDDRLHTRFPILESMGKIRYLFKKETPLLDRVLERISNPFWGYALPFGGLMIGITFTGSYGLFQIMILHKLLKFLTF